MAKSLKTDQFHLGACYYPEHWPETLWQDDYKRMREMDFSIIRVAEFAWSIFEPNEGEFFFDFFDKAIDLAHDFGLKVIMCTPTATPPAWLTHKYPEVLNVAQNGVQYQHGQRRHYNYNAPIYRELSARITRKMAMHYKDHPAVIGWQIDNELNCETSVFYSQADHAAFREWLSNKYGSLDQLNHAWGAVFWNQTYTQWDQVHLTRPTVSDSPNPHQALDEKRFFSDSAVSFAKLQADILREAAPNQWVTTNGLFGHLDSHKLTEECLDFISYDSYPNFSTIYPDGGEDPLLDRKWSWNLSSVRSMSSNFIIMEQQSGSGGWINKMEQPSPKPGQMRLWTYQSIAHGADMVLYFRWRTATVGTEIYWHGINDYHNRPNRRVKEAAQIGSELQSVGAKLVGSHVLAEVAIVRDYDNEWDGELDKWHGPFDWKSVHSWVKVLQRSHIPVDALFMREHTKAVDLAKYKTLIYPHPTILTQQTADLLKQYVKHGGNLVLGCRTGYKDLNGHCYMSPFPGTAVELCGVTVEDFTLIGPYQKAPSLKWSGAGTNVSAKADSFNEVLVVESPSVEVLATYADSYYAGKPALIKNKVGEGNVVYYGAVYNEEIVGAVVEHLEIASPVVDALTLPKDVELIIRKQPSSGEAFVFLLNYSDRPQKITLHKEAHELLMDKAWNGTVEMEAFGVSILQFI